MTDIAPIRCSDPPTTIGEILELDRIGANSFSTSPFGPDDPRGLYGGLLMAQALRAAAHTVPDGRQAHSLHSYFLKPGDATKPLVLKVEHGRDGGRFSTRSVTAVQGENVVSILSASFQRPQSGPDHQLATMPEAEDPDTLTSFPLDRRLLDLEARVPTDPDWYRWPARIWMRVREQLPPDPSIQACALTFLSDMCTGLSKVPGVEEVGLMPSLDHALWLHRPVDVNDWLLLDLLPESTAGGRGLYTGRVFSRDGTLVAALAQESLFRLEPTRRPPRP